MIMSDTRKTVLICEDRAHYPGGHWGIRFAELAEGFLEAGCDAYVLVASGWVYENEFSLLRDRIFRYGVVSRLLMGLAINTRSRLISQKVAYGLRHLALGYEVYRIQKNLKEKNIVVVSVCYGFDPYLVSILGVFQNWIVHVFLPTPHLAPRSLKILAKFSQALRRRLNKKLIVVFPDKIFQSNWKKSRSDLSSVIFPLAGASTEISNQQARETLGISQSAKLALLFGGNHEFKLPRIAIEAMRHLPDWTLYIVGSIADNFEGEAALPSNVKLKSGPVSHTERKIWHQAADLSILSFKSNYRRNSGTLMDALSASRPVVVSDFSVAADLAKKYCLGEVFLPGDIRSLVNAIKSSKPLSSRIVAAAMAELSNEAIANYHLAALESV